MGRRTRPMETMHAPAPQTGAQSGEGRPPLLEVRRHALFLDLDGTLVDIKLHPEHVTASAQVQELLRSWGSASGGALALITGRTILDADRILDGACASVAGVHGMEHRISGKLTRDERAAGELAAARDDVVRLAESGRLGARIEEKGASVALHYRHAPELEQDVRALAAQVAAKHDLRTLPGKMVIEIVAGAHTKGDAVETFMRSAPFAGRVPVAVGDDVTDEDAFKAAARGGGFGVRVGGMSSTSAAYRLATPSDVHEWLRGSLEGRA
jgi:trehalose 6-phosphate phosphatase